MKSEFIIAIHSLIYLSHMQRLVSSEELADNLCTNSVRVRNVMAKLKKNGMVYTKEGSNGGYYLLKASSDIHLDHIAEALSVRFAASTWRSGKLETECVIASGMGEAMDQLFDEMNMCCMQYLKKITIEDMSKRLLDIAESKRRN